MADPRDAAGGPRAAGSAARRAGGGASAAWAAAALALLALGGLSLWAGDPPGIAAPAQAAAPACRHGERLPGEPLETVRDCPAGVGDDRSFP